MHLLKNDKKRNKGNQTFRISTSVFTFLCDHYAPVHFKEYM
jgi:hypothetical protein